MHILVVQQPVVKDQEGSRFREYSKALGFRASGSGSRCKVESLGLWA